MTNTNNNNSASVGFGGLVIPAFFITGAIISHNVNWLWWGLGVYFGWIFFWLVVIAIIAWLVSK